MTAILLISKKYTTYPNNIVADVTTFNTIFVIGMVTTLRAGPSGVQMLAGATYISLLPNAGTGSGEGGHPTCYSKDTRFLPGGRATG
jgi:hypothetical protein